MKKKTELLRHLSNVFLTIIFGGRLPGTENKRLCQISGINLWNKAGSWSLKKSEQWSLTREYLSEKQNGYLKSGGLREVVAYGKWSVHKLLFFSLKISRTSAEHEKKIEMSVDFFCKKKKKMFRLISKSTPYRSPPSPYVYPPPCFRFINLPQDPVSRCFYFRSRAQRSFEKIEGL